MKESYILFGIYFLSLISQASSLSFFLVEGTEKCFHEDLPPEADLHGNIKLLDPLLGIDTSDKTQGVRLRVTDPDSKTIRELVFQDYARFMFTAEKLGKYQFCLSTTSSGNWIRENRKYRFSLKIHIGEDINLMNKTAKVGDLAGFNEGYRLLNNQVENFLMRQELIAAKDEKLYHDNLETDSRVIVLTVIESLVLLGLGIYQVLALRRFFIVKNLY